MPVRVGSEMITVARPRDALASNALAASGLVLTSIFVLPEMVSFPEQSRSH